MTTSESVRQTKAAQEVVCERAAREVNERHD